MTVVEHRRAPVMADVAKAAGVSHQTVSRVLNDSPNVSPVTRDRVLQAIAYLGYRRNSAARALVTRRSMTLGVVTFSSDISLYGPASTLFGVEDAARRSGYFVSLASPRSNDRAGIRLAVDRLVEQSVDGIVVIAPQVAAAEALEGFESDIPMVAVEGGPTEGVTVVAVDQALGAALATRHLVDLGHVNVLHVAGPRTWLEAESRVRGWREVLTGVGSSPVEPIYGDWSPRSGYQAGLEIAGRRAVSAVFVANDSMAIGLLLALHESGLAVPRDVSVVGFDDIAEAAYTIPPLTTIVQDFGELGRRSIEALLCVMEGTPVVTSAVLPRMVVRASTAPPGR